MQGDAIDSSGQWRNLTTPLDRIQLHVRGGHIIPRQDPANTTVYRLVNNLELFVYYMHGTCKRTDGRTVCMQQVMQYHREGPRITSSA